MTVERAQEMLLPGGHFPPWVVELGVRIEQISGDGVRARLPRSAHVQRTGGIVVGQALMAMADTMLVFTFAEALGRLPALATISLTTNFMRAAVDCDVIGRARTLKLGRSTVFGEVTFFADGDTSPIAQSTAAFAVLPDDNGRFATVGTPIAAS
ncbi:MAG: PaaI family thioesterase [Alphaproteobacteria bacterium]|nr:PaaI family thioesterase [Alphaproteobacteria bacterium]